MNRSLCINAYLILVLCAAINSVNVAAHENTVVIPMFGNSVNTLKNIVSVAGSGGDYTNPVTAMASITDASASNPYLVVIGPGIYPLSAQIIMQDYVDIIGSGQNTTFLTGSISSLLAVDSAILIGANNSSLRNLSIENSSGSGQLTVGIYNNGTSPTLENVSISVIDSNNSQYGIRNENTSSLTLKDVNIDISGGSDIQFGIWNESSDMSIVKTTINLSEGENSQFGIFNGIASSTIVTQSKITITGGDGFYNGVFISDSNSYAIIRDSVIFVSGTDNNNLFSIRPGLGSGTSESYISNTVINAQFNGGNAKCIFVFEKDGTPYDEDCDPPPT